MKKKLFLFILSFAFISTSTVANANHNYNDLLYGNFDGGEFGINKKRKRKRFKAGSSRNMYKKGVQFISLGYGYPNMSVPRMMATSKTYIFETDTDFYTDVNNKSLGVLHFRYEYAVWNHFSMSFRSNISNYDVSWEYKYTTFDINGNEVITPIKSGYKGMALDIIIRFDWHFYKTQKIDIYTGMGAGYGYNTETYYSSDKEIAKDPNEDLATINFPLAVDGTTGIRYFFNDYIAAYVEIGYTQSIVQMGVTFRFAKRKSK